jgi:hypothetical protein
MDIERERFLLIKELEQVEDLSLLVAIKAVLHYGLQKDDSIGIELYNREIEEAEARMAKGEYVLHEDALGLIRQWRTSMPR